MLFRLIKCWFNWFVGTSSRILRLTCSIWSISKLDKKSAVVFNLPGMCAKVKLICSTKSHAFHIGGGITLLWKNFVTEFLSVMTMTGFGILQHVCLTSLFAKYNGWIMLRVKGTFSFARGIYFWTICYRGIGFACWCEFLIEIVFNQYCKSCCLELASVIKIDCLSGNDCLSARRQHSFKTSLISWTLFMTSLVTFILSLFCVVFNEQEEKV